jgi:AAA+ superfamily predicted ATPase
MGETNFKPIQISLPEKQESPDDIDLLKNRNFNWEIPFFANMDQELLDFGEKIYDIGAIEDVYLDNSGKVVIEHKLECNDNNFSVGSTIKTMRIPLNIPDHAKLGCKNKDKYKCTMPVCMVIVAAYFYHQNHLSYFDKVIDIDMFPTYEEEVHETFEDISEVTLDTLFDEELKMEYNDIIALIQSEELIPDNVKLNFLQLVKVLINYERTGKKTARPSFNYAFTENTDTIDKICVGQSRCITMLSKILLHFGMLHEDNLGWKFIDFKQLTDNEVLTKENYEEDIIVLYNMHYLTEKNLVGGGSRQQEISGIIKNNFPSYILNNSDKKVFIICDKTVNVKEFFVNMPQLKMKFDTLAIPDLNADQIYHLFLKKIKNPKYELSFENDFDEKLKKYLDINYNYSPYKNLEFIDFMFQTTIKNSLKTDHPNTMVVKEFPVFRNDDNEEFDDLASLVGLNTVKQEIYNLKAFLEFKKEKEMVGDKMPSLDLHMCFFGNPGTGKTTVARLMAGILFNLGYIRYNKCIECEAKDLIANVQGATAMKTSEKIQEAMGGILFIDEAYAISESAYGGECIAALIKAMEDFRDDLIVILAGYRVEMLKFLEYNSGFKSRIAYTFEFNDYSNKELLEMTENLLKKYNFTVESYMVLENFDKIYTNARKMGNSFGNSRFVRTTVNRVLKQHAINTIKEGDPLKKNQIITVDDVKLDFSKG